MVVANSDDTPRVTVKRGRPLSQSFVFDRSNWVVSSDDALEDGPEDDDFQPGPDRTRGTSVRHAARPSPLSVLSVDSPPSEDCLKRSPQGGRWASSAGPVACPALDTSVQFLC